MTSRPSSSMPPEGSRALILLMRRAAHPLERFLHIEAASGIVLLVMACMAMAWANSPFADSYASFWHTPLGVRVGGFVFERSLEWLVNDGLMVIFFFVVGLEIRREVYEGELSEWRRAALPAAAALGGMVVPAALYLALAGAPAIRSGWGVPMATDIAFAVGVMTLLDKRVPAALRVLLLALAVIDDLGAILVIALFYSAGIEPAGLAIAAGGFAAIVVLKRLGVRSKLVYVAPALIAWAGTYAAGIHPTIAGVIIGLLTPVRAWLGASGLASGLQEELAALERARTGELSAAELRAHVRRVDIARREALSPADSLIASLHPWVAFAIMPVFALANAGVNVGGVAFSAQSWNVAAGVAIGLIVGKPVGVLLASALTLRLGLAVLPRGLTLRHLVVLGVIAGIGFTMSLFIAQLAFTDASSLAAAKIGVLVASAGSAIVGLALGRALLRPVAVAGAARTADEAECSTEA
ncbi:MAG: Na+/H+ antiporter NhaA [Polyangiaceae bacterium]